ncbi:MAG: ferredoxin family protein [Eubacteriales bacterium]|nr:ferredoxin family protein [Eubacteriales bacterium]
MSKPEYEARVIPCSARPLRFDATKCVGCNRCLEVCQVDVMLPNPQKGAPPLVFYPGECYYCGSCVMACPNPGALSLVHPLMNQTKFIPMKDPAQGG